MKRNLVSLIFISYLFSVEAQKLTLVVAVDEFFGHKSGIICVCFDNDHIITGGEDNRVLVFSVENSRKRRAVRAMLLQEEKYSIKMNVYADLMLAKASKKKKAPHKKVDKEMPQ